jgi:hypothetical protein
MIPDRIVTKIHINASEIVDEVAQMAYIKGMEEGYLLGLSEGIKEEQRLNGK